MARPSLVIVLAEDRLHQQLIFRYLRRIGLETHAVRFLLPSAGSGEQWVRERLPIEIQAYRRRSARAETRLIAIVDADNLTVEERLAQLDQKVQADQVGSIREESEQISRLVPKRNLETWILCLLGHAVDQERDYKRTRNDWKDLVGPAGETLFQWTRVNAQIPNHCILSLRRGIGELVRLDFRGE